MAKERSYSCLLQLSNIMPLRTVTSATSVQYPCVKISDRHIMPLNIGALHHAPNISSSTKPTVSNIKKFPPYRNCYTWQLVTSALHSFSYIWWP